ncbi:MAG TPA: dihydroorotate dehydrogenase [Armatimonadetes bacterium]|nr:dihydroorotate dehydrogenase [Armatimonadota bacterium]
MESGAAGPSTTPRASAPRTRRVPRPVDVVTIFWSEARRRLGKLVLCALAALLVYALPYPDLTMPMRHAAFIFILSAGLWVSEAIPLFATSLLLVGLAVLLLVPPNTDGYKDYFAAIADPVVVLFFGGFILARAATRYKLHLALAAVMLRIFGSKPRMVLLGLMVITALFAMWMSATATTAMMLAIAAPLVAQLEKSDPFRKALVLGVAFAASIGGTATPVGSPPNAVAVGALRRLAQPIDVSVPQWVMVVMPFMILMLVLTYIALVYTFRPQADRIVLEADDRPLPLTAYVVAAVFLVTVILWLTGTWHGLPAAVVALVPAVVFTVLMVIDSDDLNNLDWGVLILIGGGIALSTALQKSGLDAWLVSKLPVAQASPYLTVAIFGLFMMGISAFMSNTVAVNLLVPVALSMAAASGGKIPPLWIGFVLPLIAAISIPFPVSTPPNALAHGTGEVTTKDIARIGLPLALGAVTLLLVSGNWVLRMLGQLPAN